MNESKYSYILKLEEMLKKPHFQITENIADRLGITIENMNSNIIDIFRPRKKRTNFYEDLERAFFPELEKDVGIIRSIVYTLPISTYGSIENILSSQVIYRFQTEVKSIYDRFYERIDVDISNHLFTSGGAYDIKLFEEMLHRIKGRWANIFKSMTKILSDATEICNMLTKIFKIQTENSISTDQFITMTRFMLDAVNENNIDEFIMSSEDVSSYLSQLKKHFDCISYMLENEDNMSSKEIEVLKKQKRELSVLYSQILMLKDINSQ